MYLSIWDNISTLVLDTVINCTRVANDPKYRFSSNLILIEFCRFGTNIFTKLIFNFLVQELSGRHSSQTSSTDVNNMGSVIPSKSKNGTTSL